MYCVYFLFFSLFIFVFSFDSFNSNRGFDEKKDLTTKTLEILPNNSHFIEYLEALRRIIDFCNDHPNDIDINFYFGLFLANVNLKRMYIDNDQVFSMKLRVYLVDIIAKLEKLTNYFSYMVRKNKDPLNNKYRKIFSLFANTSTWIERLPKLDLTSIDKDISSDQKTLHSKRPLKSFDYIRAWLPNPQQSDLCLVSVALGKKIPSEPVKCKCEVFKLCHDILINGTDYGYALAHRLLLLQQARFGRGCSIFSEQEDKRLSRRFCSIAYQEVEYIASRDFQTVDLLLEHVCLCALDGHAQFLRRSWLVNILRFQTVHGCFTPDIHTTHEAFKFPFKPSVWKFANSRDHDILGGNCNGHTTALAAGTLAMAARSILQSF